MDYEKRFERQSETWTGPKLIAMAMVVLALAFAAIYVAATLVPRYVG